MNRDAIQEMCQKIHSNIPDGVDILINNAGDRFQLILNQNKTLLTVVFWTYIKRPFCLIYIYQFWIGIYNRSWFEEKELESWDKEIAINLTAPFLVSKYLYPAMKKKGDVKTFTID